MSRQRPGRPSGTIKEKTADNILNLRLYDEQLQFIESKANELKVSKAEFVRMLININIAKFYEGGNGV